MAVMCGLYLSIHVLKLPQAFMLSPELLLFRQVELRLRALFYLAFILLRNTLLRNFPLKLLLSGTKKAAIATFR
jgi:hypothetical protein